MTARPFGMTKTPITRGVGSDLAAVDDENRDRP